LISAGPPVGLRGRCGGRDLAARRVIDQAVYGLRLEIFEACTSWRMQGSIIAVNS
jgi:hypothetical protein